MAAPVPPASCLGGTGTSLLQAVAAQQQAAAAHQQAVAAPQQLVCMRPPSQASSTQAVAHMVKAGPQASTHPHQLQDLVPTCPLSIASALCLMPVSAAPGPSLEVHTSVPNNSPGGPALPCQRSPAQGWVAQSSAAAHRVATVSSAGGTATATLSPGESCPKSRLAACVSPDLQAPASLGLPAELLALFNQSAGYDVQGSKSQLSQPKASNALPDIHLPVQSALWHPGGSLKSIKDKVSSQQQVNHMLGMY